MFFLRAGFDVFVFDAVERGRSSWTPYHDVYSQAPYFRTAREAWEETLRSGPAGSWHTDPEQRHPHDGMRFPVLRMEAFMNQFVPNWGSNNTLTQRAYDVLVDSLDSSIVLTHSQRGQLRAERRAACSGSCTVRFHYLVRHAASVPFGDVLEHHPF